MHYIWKCSFWLKFVWVFSPFCAVSELSLFVQRTRIEQVCAASLLRDVEELGGDVKQIFLFLFFSFPPADLSGG